MRNEQQHDNKKTQKSIAIEKLQNEVEKLQDEVEKLQGEQRKLGTQVEAAFGVNIEKTTSTVETFEQPYPATGKCRRCKSCKHVRLPHRSNPHYTCEMRHATIEPTWTCGSYYDKKNRDILYCCH